MKKLISAAIWVISLSAFFINCAHSVTIEKNNNINVTILGAGSPQPDINRFGPSTLVEINEKLFLFDIGRGAVTRLSQLDNPLKILPRLKNIFLTHLHSDHLMGLSDIYMTGWLYGRDDEFNLYGPTGSKDLINNLREAHQADINFRLLLKKQENPTAGIDATVKEFDKDQLVYDQDGIQITAFVVDHGPIKPSFGYKIEYAGKKVIISGDTKYSDNLIKHSKNSDLIIHEVAHASAQILKVKPILNKILSVHTTPYDAGRVFEATKPKLALYNHLLLFGSSPELLLTQTKKTYSGKVVVGQDLMKIVVSDEVKVYPHK